MKNTTFHDDDLPACCVFFPVYAVQTKLHCLQSSPRWVKGYGFKTPSSLIIFMVGLSEDKDDRYSLTLTSGTSMERMGRKGWDGGMEEKEGGIKL